MVRPGRRVNTRTGFDPRLECSRTRSGRGAIGPRLSKRETAGAILGALFLFLTTLLALGGAAARPGGLWLGLPGPVAVVLASAVVLLVWRQGKGSLALGLATATVVLPLLAGAHFAGVAAFSGPVLLALLLAVLAVVAARTGLRTPGILFLPAIFFLYAAAAARVQQQVGPEGDEPHYLMVAESLLRDGDLSLERDYAEGRYLSFHDAPLEPHYRVRGKHGEIFSLHAVGLSLLILPAYALGGYPGASLFMALVAALVAREIRGGLVSAFGDGPVAEGGAWIAALSPPLLHYAGLVFTEVPAALLVAFCLRRRTGLAVGIALAFLPWLNVRYAALSAVLVLYGLWRAEGRERLKLVLPGVVSALASALYHQALYGFLDPRRVYGRRPEFSLATLPEGLPGLFLDQEFGLLVYAPVLALAVPGFLRLVRRERSRAIAAAALVAVVVLTSSTWHMWRGGFNPPGRFLVPVLPALVLLAAAALEGGLRAGAAILVGWSLWAGAVGAIEPQWVHRDRDGTAPFFRGVSGAEEWTRLLPGYVLAEPDRHRLALVWASALLLALPWRRGGVSMPRLAVAVTGFLAAAGLSSSLSHARTSGRDAVRLVGKDALAVPGGRLARHTIAAWGPDDLDWGPVYEPHRRPEGAELGSRLPLGAGEYELSVDAERLGEGEPRIELWPDSPPGTWRPVPVTEASGGLVGRLAVRPEDGAVSLRLREGGPLILKGLRLQANPPALPLVKAMGLEAR
jgi:hypothetical protein